MEKDVSVSAGTASAFDKPKADRQLWDIIFVFSGLAGLFTFMIVVIYFLFLDKIPGIGYFPYTTPVLLFWILMQTKVFSRGTYKRLIYERVYFVLKTLIAIPTIIMSYGVSYRMLGLLDGDRPVTDALSCLFFSMGTWTTLGASDLRPTPAARLLAASEAFTGVVVTAIFVGLFASLFLRPFYNLVPVAPQREIAKEQVD